MIKVNGYTIHDEYGSLDTDSETINRQGCIIQDRSGRDIVYWFEGNLPEYMWKKLAKIAEARGYKYWYNVGSYFSPDVQLARNRKPISKVRS